MRWVVIELLPLLVASAAVGLAVGYVLWRWRRQRVSPTAWKRLGRSVDQATDAHGELQARNEQLTEQLTAMQADADEIRWQADDHDRELGSARAQIAELGRELDEARGETAAADREAERLRARIRQLEAALHEAKGAMAHLVVDEAQSKHLRRKVHELETELRTVRARRVRPEATSPPPSAPVRDRDDPSVHR